MKHGIDDEGEGAARKVRRVSLSMKSLLSWPARPWPSAEIGEE